MLKRWTPWFAVLAMTQAAFGLSDEAAQRKSLRGLRGVFVLVELSQATKGGGLTESQLRSDVELQLRKAGIRVFGKEELAKLDGPPRLLVGRLLPHVGIIQTPEGAYAYNVFLLLEQNAVIANGDDFPAATTWRRTGVGYATRDNFVRSARESLRDFVDEFSNDFLAANP